MRFAFPPYSSPTQFSHLEARHAGEFADVIGDKNQAFAARVSADQQIEWNYRPVAAARRNAARIAGR